MEPHSMNTKEAAHPTPSDPFNCPTCGAHDFGLFAGSIGACPHCLKRENAELRAQLAEAERQRDEARKDAERYRWIRQEAAKSIEDEDLSDELWAVWEFLLQGNNDPDEMDAAIDAAKEKTNG